VKEKHLFVDSFASDLSVIFVIIWQSPTQHQVQYHSQAPDVYLSVVGRLKKDFRGYVAQRTKWLPTGFSWTKGLRETKIDDLDLGHFIEGAH
jgi:hypothetical protein